MVYQQYRALQMGMHTINKRFDSYLILDSFA